MEMNEEATCLSGRDALAALLERTSEIVGELGPAFGHHHRKLNELRHRFAEGRFHLAVLGQFKRGKSTLLNALAGESVLPMGVVPLTAAPTFIQYGDVPKVRVGYRDERPAGECASASAAERNAYLARFVTESGNPQNGLGVTEVQVELPAPILAGGVVLIDTPGIGSTYRHNTAVTLQFLRQCDAALFLVSADPPITEVELEFLREIREKVPRLFFVLNKIDYLNARELEEAVSFYRQVLTERIGGNEEFPVFRVSARKGLEARESGDARGWADSGMERLETFLVEFLAREKFAALSDAVSRRSVEFIDASLMEAEIALQALKLPQKTLEEKIALFAETLKRADAEGRLIHDVLEGDKRRVSAFLEEEARELRREAESFLKDVMNRSAARRTYGRSLDAGIHDAWAEAIPEFFERCQSEINERVKTRLLECLEPHERRLDQIVETLRHAAADIFQVPYRPPARDEALEIKRRPYWVLNTWNTDPLPLLKSTEQRLDELARRNVENIRWSMLQNLNVSLAHFASRVRERLAETVVATQGAMEAARRRRGSHGESVASELARLADLIDRMETVKLEFPRQGGAAG